MWLPPEGSDISLDLYIKLVNDDVINNLKRTLKSNITEQERKAMASLLNDNTIIIDPADNTAKMSDLRHLIMCSSKLP